MPPVARLMLNAPALTPKPFIQPQRLNAEFAPVTLFAAKMHLPPSPTVTLPPMREFSQARFLGTLAGDIVDQNHFTTRSYADFLEKWAEGTPLYDLKLFSGQRNLFHPAGTRIGPRDWTFPQASGAFLFFNEGPLASVPPFFRHLGNLAPRELPIFLEAPRPSLFGDLGRVERPKLFFSPETLRTLRDLETPK